jgi:hypothetical protein
MRLVVVAAVAVVVLTVNCSPCYTPPRIATHLLAIATHLLDIATHLLAIATHLLAIATHLLAIATHLLAIATHLLAIANISSLLLHISSLLPKDLSFGIPVLLAVCVAWSVGGRISAPIYDRIAANKNLPHWPSLRRTESNFLHALDVMVPLAR